MTTLNGCLSDLHQVRRSPRLFCLPFHKKEGNSFDLCWFYADNGWILTVGSGGNSSIKILRQYSTIITTVTTSSARFICFSKCSVICTVINTQYLIVYVHSLLKHIGGLLIFVQQHASFIKTVRS